MPAATVVFWLGCSTFPMIPVSEILQIFVILAVALLAATLASWWTAWHARRGHSTAPEDTQRLRRLEEEMRFLEQFLRDVPRLARGLNSQIKVREIPNVLVDFLVRTFEPQQVAVLVRGKAKLSEPDRDQSLICAACHPADGSIPVGTKLPVESALLKKIAEAKQILTADDLRTLAKHASTEATRNFPIDLAAPLLLGSEPLGLVLLSRPHRYQRLSKEVLGAVTQMSASTWSNLLALRDIRSAADVDPLTGIANKRVLDLRLSEFVYEAESKVDCVSVLLFDLDHFKNYNDVNGHLAGDQLLRTLTTLVQGFIRMDDVFGRFGGEEFMLILPGRTVAQSFQVAEKIRREIAEFEFPHSESQPGGRITISGGIAGFPEHARRASKIVQAADEALYRAKADGRNCIRIAETS